jgi:hypothetical protein
MSREEEGRLPCRDDVFVAWCVCARGTVCGAGLCLSSFLRGDSLLNHLTQHVRVCHPKDHVIGLGTKTKADLPRLANLL